MSYENNSIFWVEVDKIVPNPYQPRREFDEGKLKELAESIRTYGILQPLTVTRKEIHGEDGSFKSEYELIAGERRLRAARMAGLEQIPVIIRSDEESELVKLELAIIENLQREDLNAVDKGMAFKQLYEQFNLSHGQIAQKVGISRMSVSNTIRLLQLPEHILEAVKSGRLNESNARRLLIIKDKPKEQDTIFREILQKNLNVKQVEEITRKLALDKVRKRNPNDIGPELVDMERKFTESLGTRVQIAKTDFGGKLTIDYFSESDLNKLLSLIQSGHITNQTMGDTAKQTLAGEALYDQSAHPNPSANEPEVSPSANFLPENQPPSTTPRLGRQHRKPQGLGRPSQPPQPSVNPPRTEGSPPVAPNPYRPKTQTTSSLSANQPSGGEAQPENPYLADTFKDTDNHPPTEPAPDTMGKTEDEDLYSIKNFSI